MSTENFKNNVASYHVTCPVSNGGPTFVLFCLWVGLNKKKFKFIQFIWKWLNFILLNVNVWFTKSFIKKSNRKLKVNREKVACAHDDRVYIRQFHLHLAKVFRNLNSRKWKWILRSRSFAPCCWVSGFGLLTGIPNPRSRLLGLFRIRLKAVFPGVNILLSINQ